MAPDAASPTPAWADLVIAGETLRMRGTDGGVLVKSVSGDPAPLLALERVFIGRGPGELRALRVAAAARQHELVLMHFEGVADRESARELSGRLLLIPRAEAAPLPDDRVYLFQLPGLRVVTPDGADHGEIVDVIEGGGNDVWVARGPRGEFLIPAVDNVVLQIDRAGGRIVIEPLPGLLPE